MPHWFHWADHGGYNFVSGPLADITLITAFHGLGAALLAQAQLPRPPLPAPLVASAPGPRPPGVQAPPPGVPEAARRYFDGSVGGFVLGVVFFLGPGAVLTDVSPIENGARKEPTTASVIDVDTANQPADES